MKQCPGCGLVPSMDEETISNGDSTYHKECYRKLAEAVAEEGPDALERIADALEFFVSQQKDKAEMWKHHAMPFERAEKR